MHGELTPGFLAFPTVELKQIPTKANYPVLVPHHPKCVASVALLIAPLTFVQEVRSLLLVPLVSSNLTTEVYTPATHPETDGRKAHNRKSPLVR